MKASLVKRYWQLHSICATYTGGFLAIILITGAVAVFAGPLYNWEFRELTRIAPAQFRPEVLPDAIAKATAQLEGESIKPVVSHVHLPTEATEPVRVEYFNQGHKPKPFVPGQPWFSRSVFLHPESGAILGEASDDRSIAFYLRFIHVRLFAGTPGRNFVGLFGIALFVLSISGVFILSKFLGRKALWLIRRDSPRNLNSDTHKLVGFVVLLPALLFAITGFWLGMQGRLMDWFSIERPDSFEREAVIDAATDTDWKIDFGQVLEAGRAVHPELTPQLISWSRDGQRVVRIQGRVPGMIYERYSQGVVLDKEGYAPLKVINTPQADWKEKLFYLQEALHFGDFAGNGVRALYLVVGLLLGLLPLTGYAIQRMRSRKSLRSFWMWNAFGIAYLVGSLLLLKLQGVIMVASFGTVGLWLFVLALFIIWTWQAIAAKKKKTQPTRP